MLSKHALHRNLSLHALEVTPFGLKFSLEDWELFKVIMDNSKTILKAIKALAEKQKMPEDEGEENTLKHYRHLSLWRCCIPHAESLQTVL